jgi:hypothetical protein
MAKNTSKKSAEKKNSFFKKISSLKWYSKLLLLIAVSLLLFLTFKESVNRYNISLLDQAEAKMRQMNVPEADHTVYRRSCSFKSVKFGSAGSPNCRVTRTDVYNLKTGEQGTDAARAYINQARSDYPDSSVNYVSDTDFATRLALSIDSSPTVNLRSMQDSLNCYTNTRVSDNLPTSSQGYVSAGEGYGYLIATTSCYKVFFFQTYPEI